MKMKKLTHESFEVGWHQTELKDTTVIIYRHPRNTGKNNAYLYRTIKRKEVYMIEQTSPRGYDTRDHIISVWCHHSGCMPRCGAGGDIPEVHVFDHVVYCHLFRHHSIP